MPTRVVAGESFSLELTCTSPEPKLCPTYYMVLFHGPTRLSVDPELFGPLNWTYASPYEYATLTAQFTIQDPGQYRVYAYPELYYCSQWRNLEFSFQKAAVQGSPWDIVVLPPHHTSQTAEIEEGFGTCSAEQIHEGRYLSIDSSPTFHDIYKYTNRQFIYAPYQCKIPARTVKEAIQSIQGVQHIVHIGDSVLRNPFCKLVWRGAHGTVEGTTCDPRLDGFHRSHKFTSVMVEKDGHPMNVNLSFIWTQDWEYFKQNNLDLVLALNPPPTHIVLNFGL